MSIFERKKKIFVLQDYETRKTTSSSSQPSSSFLGGDGDFGGCEGGGVLGGALRGDVDGCLAVGVGLGGAFALLVGLFSGSPTKFIFKNQTDDFMKTLKQLNSYKSDS
jgi:hypothetical protein